MKVRLAVCLLLGLFALPVVLGCGSDRPDPKDNPDFVDTSDPSKVQMKPIGSPEDAKKAKK
jgi:hypothetical protein